MRLIVDILVRALILLLTTYLVPGFVIDSLASALLVVIVLGILNVLVKPILLLLTLPINILTLGLFTFVINALILYLAASFVPGFRVSSFGAALFAALVIAVLSGVFSAVFKS